MPSPNLVAEVPVLSACIQKLTFLIFICTHKERTNKCYTFLCESQPQKRTTRLCCDSPKSFSVRFAGRQQNPKRRNDDLNSSHKFNFEMDNKRKVVGTVLGKGPAKLRKISLNAFETADTIQEDPAVNISAGDTKHQITASTAPGSDTVDPALQEVIIKTALWIFNNSDKATALVEKSSNNPMLSFLLDAHGTSAPGRMYLRELQRLKTEKEVQAVCSGFQEAPIVHASQIASFIEQSRTQAYNIHPSLTASAIAPAAPRERKNRWGPSHSETATAPPTAANITSAPILNVATSAASSSSTGAASRFSAAPSKDTHISSEAAQIAQLAADFDHNDSARIERLIREQQEMQLLESRIRDAASQGLSGGSADNKNILEVAKFLSENAHKTHIDGHSAAGQDAFPVSIASRKGPALLMAEKQAALYLERLAQYQELAALDDDNYRDTVEEAERNGGVIEGGTWEHRKRAKEMLTTAAKSLELTLLGSGKHHMADYLPPDVLDAFLKNAENVVKGTPSSVSTVEVNRIDETNVGFQLLKKSGWSEGTGLGAQNSGILNPISSTQGNHNNQSNSNAGGNNPARAPVIVNGVIITGGSGPEGAGIGVAATHEVNAEDTEFDQYRKRMMLAYRFRPNPLNNPRRNYY